MKDPTLVRTFQLDRAQKLPEFRAELARLTGHTVGDFLHRHDFSQLVITEEKGQPLVTAHVKSIQDESGRYWTLVDPGGSEVVRMLYRHDAHPRGLCTSTFFSKRAINNDQ